MCSSSGELIASILITVKIFVILDHLIIFRVAYTRCRIDTIDSPDDEHRGARNLYRIGINIYEKELCVKLAVYRNIIYI